MGRKIPGAKHHGVKDPLKQQEKRLKSLKNKINAPPSHPDDQPIPKSLTRLLEYKEKQEQRVKKKKNTEKIPMLHNRGAGESGSHPMSGLSRLPGESGRSFNLRINSVLHSINRRQLQISEMDRSLNPDNYLPEEDAKEGRFDSIQKHKQKRKQKEERKNKSEGSTEAPTKLSRMQRWTVKKKERKAEKLAEKDTSFEPQYERIKFGEIVHEPPSLHIKPRKAQEADGAPRPGRKNLLLNKLLEGTSKIQESIPIVPKITLDSKTIALDRKAKRKTLPFAVRMRLEQSQKEAIDAYRSIKAKAMKTK